MAYLSLLKAVKEDSLADIESFCERTLYREIQAGLPKVYKEAERIELLNEDLYPGNLDVRVVDFNQTFGAFIDREENREREVK